MALGVLRAARDGGHKQGLRSFLESQLREIKAEIFEIGGRYGVSSVEEMEAQYRDGTLEEAHSWRDLERLDHLEHKQDRLLTHGYALFPLMLRQAD